MGFEKNTGEDIFRSFYVDRKSFTIFYVQYYIYFSFYNIMCFLFSV